MLKLAFQSIFYHKKRAAAVLTGMVLSIALLTGISSLIASGRQSNIQNCKEIYGDWNYVIFGDEETAIHLSEAEGEGCLVKKYGILKAAGFLEEEQLSLQYADASYLEMMNQPVLEGSYPQQKNEIAMSRFTLDNLNRNAGVGDLVTLNGRSYRICGILKDPWSLDIRVLTAFVSKEAVEQDADSFVYLKMDESVSLYRQERVLRKQLDANGKIKENRNLNGFFGEEDPKGLLSMIWKAVFDRDVDPYVRSHNFTYYLLAANAALNLSLNGTILFLGLFSLFIIYSVFQIGMEKRMSEYGILQAMGIGQGNQFLLVLAELWSLLLVGFPAGTLAGNGAAAMLYSRFYTVFLDMGIVRPVSQHGGSETKYYTDAARLTAQGFQVSMAAVIFGALFLTLTTAWIAWRISCKTEKMTVIQMLHQMSGDRIRKRKTIYSRKKCDMPALLNRKFMLRRKKSFFSILLSLSLGGAVFLCVSYVLVNAKESSQMQLASDDGLGNDFKLYENHANLNQTISQREADAFGSIQGIRESYPVKSYICELIRKEEEIIWKPFFVHVNENYGAAFDEICRQLTDGEYAVKSNLLGYNDSMIGQLRPYLLDGDIQVENMNRRNEVIVVDMMDGQGNYGGFSLTAGDTITLRVPDRLEGTIQDFRQKGHQQEMEFTIAAVVKRPLLRDSWLYEDVEENSDGYTFSIIMTQEQMQRSFGISGYRVIGLKAEEHAGIEAVADEIQAMAADMDGVFFQDYTGSIRRQKEYLTQKAFFYYGIAAMFFIISLFHIMNTMNHIILSGKHEYGILRAMGITDQNLVRMMLRQGLSYGCLSSVLMIVFYFMSQEIARYFMVHVSRLLMIDLQVSPWLIAGTVAANIFAGIFAVMAPAYAVIKEDIIPQINR